MALKNTKASYDEEIDGMAIGKIFTTNVRNLAQDTFANRPANFLLILNGGNKNIIATVGGIRYPITANNGVLGIKRDDLIRFSNLVISNESGVVLLGKINLTYGWLYQDIVGDLDVIDKGFN